MGLGVVVGVIVYSQWHSYIGVVVGVTASIVTWDIVVDKSLV